MPSYCFASEKSSITVFTTSDVYLDPLVRVVSVRFLLTVKLLFFFSSLAVLYQKRVMKSSEN